VPLACLRGENVEFAFAHDRWSWDDLKEHNRRSSALRFGCCDSKVTMKMSPLGTRYFAHRGRNGCSTAPESAEHLFAKATICTALGQAGWIAEPEARLRTDVQDVVVDVLASSPISEMRYAFEV
jgi:competence protein CoiA